MKITKKVYKREKGWMYEILQDGIPFIIQDYLPDVNGFVSMTKEQAEELSNELLNKFKKEENDTNK